jgi:hypothetical protein
MTKKEDKKAQQVVDSLTMFEKIIQKLLDRCVKATFKGAITLIILTKSVTCAWFFTFGNGNLIWC